MGLPRRPEYSEPMVAYLDPATGGMILQALAAGVAGAAVVSKLYWQRAKRVLGLGRRAPSEEESAP